MKTFSVLLSCLCACLTACAATNAATVAPVPETAAAATSCGQVREPGTMVVRKPLVEMGSADLLEPISVPAAAVSVVERMPGVATSGPSSSGCETGPGGVRIKNATEFPVALRLDGAPVTVIGDGTLSRFVGPRTSAYLCLDPSQAHAVEGFALRASNGRLFAIPNRFRADVRTAAEGQTTFTVSYALIADGD